MSKTHWRSCDKTDFLGSADIEELTNDESKDLIAIISKVEIKEVKVRGKKDTCRVATFTNTSIKPMIINVGNGKILKGFANSKHIEDWVNIPVSIYVNDSVKFGTETMEGLRFRPQQPQLKKAELTPEHSAWEKAKEAVKQGKLNAVLSRYEVSDDNLKKLKSEV